VLRSVSSEHTTRAQDRAALPDFEQTSSGAELEFVFIGHLLKDGDNILGFAAGSEHRALCGGEQFI
jgi:hypothetical protein